MIKLHVRDLTIILMALSLGLIAFNNYLITERIQRLENEYQNHRHAPVNVIPPDLLRQFRLQNGQGASNGSYSNGAASESQESYQAG